jgi:hypothetical protein
VTWVKWKLVSVYLEIVLTSAQDRCTDWDERKARKSFWAQTMEVLGNVGQMEARFGLFGDCANLDTRLVRGLR